jgi:sulfur-carrier protein adenylyltransferase/sulfurtransferase
MMKIPYIKVLGLLVVVLAIGLVFTSLKTSKKYKFSISAVALHRELVSGSHLMDPATALELLQENDVNYIFIDIRNPRDYDNFHIEGALNIPMQRVLDDEYIPYLKNSKTKVLYSNESMEADQVRLLLTQYGYENLMVLQGGALYWKENMLNADVFRSKGEFDDEKLKFDLTKLKEGA